MNIFKKKIRIRAKKKVIINALLTAMAAGVCLAAFNFYLISSRKADITYRITSVADYQLTGVFNRYVSIADNWTALLMANNGQLDQQKFDEICEKLFAQYHDPAIRCMQLAPQGVIKYAYPLEGFESAINGNNFSGHRKKESEHARDTGEATMGGPYTLTQGGIACIIRDPLYLKDEQGEKKFWGFATIILRYPEVLKAVDMDGESQIYDYKISHLHDQTGVPETILESSPKNLTDPVSVDFAVPNGTWTLSAEWKGGWVTRKEVLMEILLLLLLAGLAGFYTEAYYRQHHYETALRRFINESDEALSVAAKDGSEVFMCNNAFRRLWGDSDKFRSGLSYKEFYKNPSISLQELLDNGGTVITNRETKHKIVIYASEIDWDGTPAVLLRGKEYDLEYFDELTLLPNQFYFEKQSGGVIKKMQDNSRQPVCVFYNIVGMKFFNAENGYDAGDTLLKETAHVLQDVYGDALVARLNNDNFCLLTHADGLQEKLKTANLRISLLGGAARVDIKAGIFGIQKDSGLTIAEIIDAAKMAAESIHDDVERHYRYYDDDLRRQLLDRRFIREHLDRALQEKEFEVYYQPVIRALTGELAGYEALVRWNSKELGFLPPFRFIPILEQSHQITAVDTYVIREICRQYRESVDAGRPVVPVSFNLSRVDLMRADMCKIITETADAYHVPHDMLHVEITESMLMNNEEKMQKDIKRFHEAGFQVWMDDFGSGYSNLNTLKDFDFDVIKLDMKFLSSMSPKSKSILYSTVSMAKQIGIETLAEGCETQDHYDFLRAIGCEKIQGWYFGKPLPLIEARKNLADQQIAAERSKDAAFYRTAGQMLYPLHEPFAIVEKKADLYHYLYANPAYIELTKYVTGMSVAGVEEVLKKHGTHCRDFLDAQLQGLSVGQSRKIAYTYDGHDVILTTSLLKRNGERLLICLMQENTRTTNTMQTNHDTITF